VYADVCADYLAVSDVAYMRCNHYAKPQALPHTAIAIAEHVSSVISTTIASCITIGCDSPYRL
jgi:hypothetical protein